MDLKFIILCALSVAILTFNGIISGRIIGQLDIIQKYLEEKERTYVIN